MHRGQSWPAALALALLLAAAGCEDEDRGGPCASSHWTGVIEGHVITGGVPVETALRAVDCISGDLYRTECDSTGAYRIELPAGPYWVTAYRHHAPDACYNADGPPYDQATRDTVDVKAGSATTADFLFGSMRIEVMFPASAEGSQVTFIGYPVGEEIDPQGCPDHYDFRVTTEVENQVAAATLGGLAPGPFLMQMEVASFDEFQTVEQTLWLPAARSCAEAETIQVIPGAIASYHGVVPSIPARVTGSILGSWQELIFDLPTVTLVTLDSSAVVASIRTRSDGTFAGDILAPEPVRARIDIGGSSRWYPRGSFQQSTVLELAPGVTLPPIEVEESGLILDISYPLHPPSWDARVQLLSPALAQVVATREIDADDDRPFYPFPNLDPGDYWLRVLPPLFLLEDWRPQWYDRAPGLEGATLVHVPADGGIGRVNIVLETGGLIKGCIWYVNTPETYGALVYISQADDPTALGHILPGSGG